MKKFRPNGCSAISNHIFITVYPLTPVSISENGHTLTAYNDISWQWYLNDTLIPDATDSSYVYNSPGTYTVEVTNANGCHILSSPFVINISSIYNIIKNPLFEFYPDPISGSRIQLIICESLIGNAVEIYDVQGRLLFKIKINQTSDELDIGALAGGIYLVKINGAVERFIKE